MLNVWKKTKDLETKIDQYLDFFIEASLCFREGLSLYIKNNFVKFEEKTQRVDMLESTGDAFRREIENVIYTELLIPESRGDVLAIIENADSVLNKISEVMTEFSIQKPFIPDFMGEPFVVLLDATDRCVQEMIFSTRMYFKNLQEVRDHIIAVMHYEHECDDVGNEMKRAIFSDNSLDLCHKLQTANFVKMVQEVSDKAEDVCDRLSIYVIKRMA